MEAAGRQKISENTLFYRNDKRVMNALRKLPKVKEMAKVLLRYLLTKCRVEEYGLTTSIEYGANPKEIDFIYVLRGEMIFQLDQCKLEGSEIHKNSAIIKFVRGEWIDIKTITEKYLKRLKNYNPTTRTVYNHNTANGLLVLEKEESSVAESATTNLNKRQLNPFLNRIIGNVRV